MSVLNYDKFHFWVNYKLCGYSKLESSLWSHFHFRLLSFKRSNTEFSMDVPWLTGEASGGHVWADTRALQRPLFCSNEWTPFERSWTQKQILSLTAIGVQIAGLIELSKKNITRVMRPIYQPFPPVCVFMCLLYVYVWFLHPEDFALFYNFYTL